MFPNYIILTFILVSLQTIICFDYEKCQRGDCEDLISSCEKLRNCCAEIHEESLVGFCSITESYCSVHNNEHVFLSKEWIPLVSKCTNDVSLTNDSGKRNKRSPSRGLLILFMKIHPKLNMQSSSYQGFSNDRQRRLGNRLGNEFLGKRTFDPNYHYFKKYVVGLNYQAQVHDLSPLSGPTVQKIGSGFNEILPTRENDEIHDVNSPSRISFESEIPDFSKVANLKNQSLVLSRDISKNDDKYTPTEFSNNDFFISQATNKRTSLSKVIGRRKNSHEMVRPMFGNEFLGKRMVGNEFLGKRGKVPRYQPKTFQGNEFLGKREADNSLDKERTVGKEFLGKRSHLEDEEWTKLLDDLKFQCIGQDILNINEKASEKSEKRNFCIAFLLDKTESDDTSKYKDDIILANLPKYNLVSHSKRDVHSTHGTNPFIRSILCQKMKNCALLRSLDSVYKEDRSKRSILYSLNSIYADYLHPNRTKRNGHYILVEKKNKGKVLSKPFMKGSEFLGKRSKLDLSEGKNSYSDISLLDILKQTKSIPQERALTTNINTSRGEPEYTDFIKTGSVDHFKP